MSRTLRVDLDWLLRGSRRDSNINVRFVHTNQQIAVISTSGSFCVVLFLSLSIPYQVAVDRLLSPGTTRKLGCKETVAPRFGLISLDARSRAAECVVFGRTQQVATSQCLRTILVSICAGRGRRHSITRAQVRVCGIQFDTVRSWRAVCACTVTPRSDTTCITTLPFGPNTQLEFLSVGPVSKYRCGWYSSHSLYHENTFKVEYCSGPGSGCLSQVNVDTEVGRSKITPSPWD